MSNSPSTKHPGWSKSGSREYSFYVALRHFSPARPFLLEDVVEFMTHPDLDIPPKSHQSEAKRRADTSVMIGHAKGRYRTSRKT